MAASIMTKLFRNDLCRICGRIVPPVIHRKLCQQPETSTELKGVIGLEIHAQIQSKSKLFSGAETTFGGRSNSQVALLDAALPGTLPVLNKHCVKAGILTALALKCKINKISKFDRKHYFYADLPAGYQITQQRQPLAVEGKVNYLLYKRGVDKVPIPKSVELVQIQLEQDSGKSLHDDQNKQSLIDLNRAGVGLMEIITKPEFNNGTEAAAFVTELQKILRVIGTCDGKMEEGSLRVDANISVHKPGEPLGVRTEVKNLNSLRSVTKSIDYEIKRQIQEVENGREIENETRSFDTVLGETVPMRDKEKKQDYRFMPEPNLPPLHLFDNESIPDSVSQTDVINVDVLRKDLPELPEETRNRLMQQYAISLRDAKKILDDGVLEHFEKVIQHVDKAKCKRYFVAVEFIVANCVGVTRRLDMELKDIPISPKAVAEVSVLLSNEEISDLHSEKLLEIMITDKNENAISLIDEHNLRQINDREELMKICREVVDAHPKRVKKYQNGKTKEFSHIARFALKNTDGRGNFKMLCRILTEMMAK